MIGVCGKPRDGIHAYRLFDFAIVDVILTFLIALIFSKVSGVSMWVSVPFTFTAGIVVHKALGINTKLNSIIFNPK